MMKTPLEAKAVQWFHHERLARFLVLQGLGLWIQCAGIQCLYMGQGFQSLGPRVQGLGFMVYVQAAELSDQDIGHRVVVSSLGLQAFSLG